MASPSILGMTIADRVEATIAVYAPTRYHLCLNAYFVRRSTTLIVRPPRSLFCPMARDHFCRPRTPVCGWRRP